MFLIYQLQHQTLQLHYIPFSYMSNPFIEIKDYYTSKYAIIITYVGLAILLLITVLWLEVLLMCYDQPHWTGWAIYSHPEIDRLPSCLKCTNCIGIHNQRIYVYADMRMFCTISPYPRMTNFVPVHN